MPDNRVKISTKSYYHALQNLSPNPTAKFSESDDNRRFQNNIDSRDKIKSVLNPPV